MASFGTIYSYPNNPRVLKVLTPRYYTHSIPPTNNTRPMQ